MKMKALVVEQINRIEIKEVEIPELKPDEILVKVIYSGVCGTDLAIYSGETSFVADGFIKYPVRIGHEWSGVVSKTGARVTKFSQGDRVVSDNGITCRECEGCKTGIKSKCSNIKSVGTINCWDGSFAEYIVIPECHLYKLPDEISLKSAALIEPASIAMGGVAKRKIDAETVVAVIGTGAIGLAAVALAKNAGAKTVIMIGRTESKLEIAKKMGADISINSKSTDAKTELMKLTGNKGADFIIETSGAKETIALSISCAALRGTIALIGFYETLIDGLDIDQLVMKEVTLTGVMGDFESVSSVLTVMQKDNVRFDGVITGITDFNHAIDVFINAKQDRKQRIKTLVKIADDPDIQ